MPNSKRSIDGIPLGMWVRKQIGKAFIFRVRMGNGSYGAIAGHRYQDKYTYVVPGSINNPEGEPSRANFRAAVDYWKNVLTTSQKEAYNKRASRIKGKIGYNLFLKEALTGVFHMFVDRGDPAAVDFGVGDFTTDGTWRDLDLSGIVPSTARAVLMCGHVEGNAVDWTIKFRKNGNSNETNYCSMNTLRAAVERHRSMIVGIGSDGIVEYNADNEAWDTLDLVVRGWWT